MGQPVSLESGTVKILADDDPWASNVPVIRDFVEHRDSYERLGSEVAYILRASMKKEGIETASISSRAKTLNSFLEKITRKTYANPLTEITDLAGARVVCLYRDDLPKIEAAIRRDFEVLEKVDKLNDKGVDQFGYGAVHFVVRLGAGATGARYDDLRTLVCEVQTRTVLQDAWAIIQHHLVYKHENEIPSVIQRRLNGLAGLVETADDQYQQIRSQRDSYIQELEASKSEPNIFLQNDVNLDSLREYLTWKFPDRDVEDWSGQLALIFNDWDPKPFPKLQHIEWLMENTRHARSQIQQQVDEFKERGDVPSPAIEFAWAAALLDANMRSTSRMPTDWKTVLDRLSSTLEKRQAP